MRNPFGKGSLISLLRQFSSLHKSRAQISVGLIGYPNTGKSSLINTLRSKKVCKTAPIPGETKVWQYITLMKRIYLIDCPGVVPPSQNDTDSDLLLRGVVRVENVENPAQYVNAALGMCERRHIERTYGVTGWKGSEEFLERMAEKSGKLMKGGERDLDSAAKMFLNDFLRGKVPWFVKPPGWGEGLGKKEGEAGREKEASAVTRGDVTKLNQQAAVQARKRKRDEEEEEEEEEEGEMDQEAVPSLDRAGEELPSRDEEDGDDFEAFSSDDDDDVDAAASKANVDADVAEEGDEGSTPEPEDGDDAGGGTRI